MTFWAAGAVVLGTVGSGLLSAKAANKQSSANYANQLAQETEAWTTNLADNKAIAEANLQNTIRTGYRAGILNMQRGMAKQEAVESGLNLNKASLVLTGTASANSFAAGQMGPSVDAVLLDIQQRRDEASNQISEGYLIQEQNFDIQMHDILTAGEDSIQSARKVSVSSPAQPTLISGFDTLLSSGISLIGQYGSSQMSLGLGSKKTSGKPTNELF